MKTIYLIRHCKAAGQQPDAALTEEGVKQAESLSRFLHNKSIEHIVSSPYRRAVETLKPLSEALKLESRLDERLRERVLSTGEHPDWRQRLERTYSELDLKFEGGESSREAMDRGTAVIRDLLERAETSFAVVTHGALLSLILKHYDDGYGFDDWRKLTNPDVYKLSFAEGSGKAAISRVWE
jgi:2,3-bisphosphoglycerate-dependent phosphoglycerate mutase